MERCFGCKKRIWPWQCHIFTMQDIWHKVCLGVWSDGYNKGDSDRRLIAASLAKIPSSFPTVYLSTSPVPIDPKIREL